MDGQSGVLIACRASAPAIDRTHRTRRPRRPWRPPVAVALLALATLALVLASPVAALVAKGLGDPFFHSTSSGAAVSLLGLVALGAIVFAIDPLRDVAAGIRTAALWGLGAVVLGNAANLGAHAAVMQALDLPQLVPVYHWAGEANTYSYVLHSHAGKVGLGALFAGIAAAWAPSYDIGAGLATLVPAWSGAAFAAALVVAAVALVLLVPAVCARFPGRAMPLLYVYCAFNSVKAIVDGGPLTYRFLPVLIVLAGIVAATTGMRRERIVTLAPAGAVLLALYVAFWAAVSPDHSAAAIGDFGETAATIALLLALAWRAAAPLQRLARRAAVGLAAAAVGLGVVVSMATTPLLLLVPLGADARAAVCDLPNLACRQRSAAGERPIDVYRDAGDDALKPRRTMIFRAGDEGPSRLLLVVHPLRTASARAVTGSAAAVRPLNTTARPGSVLVEADAGAGLPRLFGSEPAPFSSPNYYVFLHLVAARLRSQGLADFAVVPLRDAADARAFGVH